MRKLTNYELENIYGGFIIQATAIVSLAILAIAAYKIATSETAKIKLPGGTDISFNTKKSSSQSSSKTKKSKLNTKSISTQKKVQDIELKQLDSTSETYTSTPSNFLVKM